MKWVAPPFQFIAATLCSSLFASRGPCCSSSLPHFNFPFSPSSRGLFLSFLSAASFSFFFSLHAQHPLGFLFSNQMKTNVWPLLLLVFFRNSKMLLAHSSSSTNFGLLSWACQRWKGSLQIHVKTHMNIWRTNLTLKPHLYYFQDQILLISY